jgi:hypothetical protein
LPGVVVKAMPGHCVLGGSLERLAALAGRKPVKMNRHKGEITSCEN